jgi:hypothetical protein
MTDAETGVVYVVIDSVAYERLGTGELDAIGSIEAGLPVGTPPEVYEWLKDEQRQKARAADAMERVRREALDKLTGQDKEALGLPMIFPREWYAHNTT